jgi:hypothetical protein
MNLEKEPLTKQVDDVIGTVADGIGAAANPATLTLAMLINSSQHTGFSGFRTNPQITTPGVTADWITAQINTLQNEINQINSQLNGINSILSSIGNITVLTLTDVDNEIKKLWATLAAPPVDIAGWISGNTGLVLQMLGLQGYGSLTANLAAVLKPFVDIFTQFSFIPGLGGAINDLQKLIDALTGKTTPTPPPAPPPGGSGTTPPPPPAGTPLGLCQIWQKSAGSPISKVIAKFADVSEAQCVSAYNAGYSAQYFPGTSYTWSPNA